MEKLRRAGSLVLAALIAAAGHARAQDSRPVGLQIVAGGGWHHFDKVSALKGGGTLEGQALYYLAPGFGLGFYTSYTLTQSDGTMFPPAALSFVDSTTFTYVSQSIDLWQYGAQARVQFGRRIAPFLAAGAGAYTVFLDPQQSGRADNTTGFAARLGAGIDFRVSQTAGIQLAVSDAYFPNWRPERLMSVREEFRNRAFPELNPDPGALKESVHNFRFVAAVTLFPGSR